MSHLSEKISSVFLLCFVFDDMSVNSGNIYLKPHDSLLHAQQKRKGIKFILYSYIVYRFIDK